MEEGDRESIRTLLSYLLRFLYSNKCQTAHEYYGPPFVYYSYCKLIELCETISSELQSIQIGSIKPLLIQLLLHGLSTKWKNPLEIAFSVTSLIILGYRGSEIRKCIEYLLDNQKNNHWEAYQFYKQRHPHRIFGSKGLTTVICLEALTYWKDLVEEKFYF